ncbi:MAG TPA: hypothetical protein VN517_16140 [Terriglobales bacterium]|nr:hypothetical protein [Terriglobales bacterium]
MQPLGYPAVFEGKRAIPSKEVTDLMLELLDLKPGEKLLEIGTGSGYQTKRFAETGAEVHTIEIEPWIEPTVDVGECVFGYYGDGSEGISSAAPFAAFVATCGVAEIPCEWVFQLADGGRGVVPIGDGSGQKLTLLRKGQGGELVPIRVAAYVRFQMLRSKPKPQSVRPHYAHKPGE